MARNDTVIVITGAGTGIDRALAESVVSQGVRYLVPTDIDAANAAKKAAVAGTNGLFFANLSEPTENDQIARSDLVIKLTFF